MNRKHLNWFLAPASTLLLLVNPFFPPQSLMAQTQELAARQQINREQLKRLLINKEDLPNDFKNMPLDQPDAPNAVSSGFMREQDLNFQASIVLLLPEDAQHLNSQDRQALLKLFSDKMEEGMLRSKGWETVSKEDISVSKIGEMALGRQVAVKMQGIPFVMEFITFARGSYIASAISLHPLLSEAALPSPKAAIIMDNRILQIAAN